MQTRKCHADANVDASRILTKNRMCPSPSVRDIIIVFSYGNWFQSFWGHCLPFCQLTVMWKLTNLFILGSFSISDKTDVNLIGLISFDIIGLAVLFEYCYNWAASCQNQQNDSASSEDSGQPGHPPRLIGVFACAQWVAKDPSFLHADIEDWSDWVDAQADPSRRWVHMPFCWFCHEAAQLILFDLVTLGLDLMANSW